jgi:hypothetical protein
MHPCDATLFQHRFRRSSSLTRAYCNTLLQRTAALHARADIPIVLEHLQECAWSRTSCAASPRRPPVQVCVIIYALHNIIGLYPALAGLAATILLVPLNTLTGKIVHRFRKELIAKTDTRVKIMTEIINGAPPMHACTLVHPAHCMGSISFGAFCQAGRGRVPQGEAGYHIWNWGSVLCARWARTHAAISLRMTAMRTALACGGVHAALWWLACRACG